MKITDNLAIAKGSTLTIVTSSATANRALVLPDKAGTIAVVADIPTIREYTEAATITTQNQATLARSPILTAGYGVKMIVNGHVNTNIETPVIFTVTGTAIAWNSANAGFTLETTDKVIVEYWA